MIQAVLFDLDGTLHDRETAVRRCIADQFERFARQLGPVRKEEFLARFAALDERGYVPRSVVYERMGSEFGLLPSLSQALLDDYFRVYPAFSVGFPKMEETLAWLRDRGMKLGIVTNGSRLLQLAKLQNLGISHYFEAVVISEVEGLSKPDRRIFDLALDRLGVAPAEAVFVGDHPEVDIRGAQRACMRAIWKPNDYWGPCPSADVVIGELDELRDVLGANAQHLFDGNRDQRQNGADD